MNRILLGTTLLLTAGFSGLGQAAHAAPTYTASTVIVSPKGEYDSLYPNWPLVPFSVTSQFVDVSGATPASTINISWSMVDVIDVTGKTYTLANNNSTFVPVATDSQGHFRRYLNNNGTGNASVSYYDDPRVGSSPEYFNSTTVVRDVNGQGYTRSQQATWTIARYT